MIFLRCCEADKKRKLEKVCMKIPLVQDVSASSETKGIFLKKLQLFHIFIKSDGVVCGRLEKLEVYFYYLNGYVICL